MKIAVILLLFFLKCSMISTPGNRLFELRDFYYSQDPFECLELYQPPGKEFQQVIMIRHGEPDIELHGWRTRDDAIRFIEEYDAAGVIPFDVKPVCTKNLNIDTVYHSSLERARHTARLTFGDNINYVEKYEFRELERQVMPFFNIRLPGGFWSTVSRILWFFGANDDQIETAREAEERVKNGVQFLSEQAEKNGEVILVSHGLLNEFLVRQFKKEGWNEVYDGGNEFLSVRIVARMNSKTP